MHVSLLGEQSLHPPVFNLSIFRWGSTHTPVCIPFPLPLLPFPLSYRRHEAGPIIPTRDLESTVSSPKWGLGKSSADDFDSSHDTMSCGDNNFEAEDIK